MKRNSFLIFSLILFDTFILVGMSVFLKTFLFTNANEVLTSSQVVSLENDVDVSGISDTYKYGEIEICCENFCHTIPSDIVNSWYDGSNIKLNEVYVYIADKVYPYFENNFGGKDIVKNSNGEFLTWRNSVIPDLRDLHLRLEDILKSNLEGEGVKSIRIKQKDLPGTNGKYADKYIEIDNSKQKLYVWNQGDVVKIISLSGPKYGYQVYGVFPIIDKGISPIAPGGKYMPYWMAFYYSPKQDSWYGLHALIWWYSDDGDKIYESLNNIGQRKSAGCIRMLLEDSKYLYENFEIGDPVLIHE